MECGGDNAQCQRLSSAFYKLCRTWRTKTIQCPHCVDSMDFLTFHTTHVREVHGIDTYLQCPFCVDNVCWSRGDKTKLRNLTHLHKCLKNLLDNQKRLSKAISQIRKREASASSAASSAALEEDPIDLCNCVYFKSSDHALNMDMRTRVSEYARAGFYDPGILELHELSSKDSIPFQESSGLGKEASAIYEMFKGGRWTFYHVMVRGYAFQKFVDVFTPMRDTVFVAPFWCLCDAYKGEDETLSDVERQHRHMILGTSNRVTFNRAWTNNLKVSGPGYCKTKQLIEDELHFFYAIRYVSQRKSSCDGILIRDNQILLSGPPSHFCIGRPLYPHCLLAMCAMSETGVQKMVSKHNEFKKMDERWVDSVEEYWSNQRHRKYRLPLRVTNIDIRNCCIPVRKDFEPTTDSSSAEITLYALDKCMYFKRNDRLASLDDEDWFRHAASRGNVFLNYLDDSWYDLGKTQTYVMNMLVRIRDEFDARMAVHEEGMSRMLNEARNEERERLRNELEAERLRNELRNETDAKLEAAERENERLRGEAERLRNDGKLEAAERERLRDEADRLKDAERLRNELAALREVVRLGNAAVGKLASGSSLKKRKLSY